MALPSPISGLGAGCLPRESLEFGAGHRFGATSPVTVDEGVPFVGYSACPPACSEEGAGDGGDSVGVMSNPDGSNQRVAEMLGWLFRRFGCVDDC